MFVDHILRIYVKNTYMRKARSEIQSILIDRDYYTKKQAIRWMDKHGFIRKKIHTTRRYYRFRQKDPKYFKRFRVLDIKPGIKFVLGFRK